MVCWNPVREWAPHRPAVSRRVVEPVELAAPSPCLDLVPALEPGLVVALAGFGLAEPAGLVADRSDPVAPAVLAWPVVVLVDLVFLAAVLALFGPVAARSEL